jgi:hypothetical protein
LTEGPNIRSQGLRGDGTYRVNEDVYSVGIEVEIWPPGKPGNNRDAEETIRQKILTICNGVLSVLYEYTEKGGFKSAGIE